MCHWILPRYCDSARVRSAASGQCAALPAHAPLPFERGDARSELKRCAEIHQFNQALLWPVTTNESTLMNLWSKRGNESASHFVISQSESFNAGVMSCLPR